MARPFSIEQVAGFAGVLALHAVVLGGLWQHRLIPNPQKAVTLFVDFIAAPAPEKKTETRPSPSKPTPIEKPQPRQLVAKALPFAPTDYAAPPPAPEPTSRNLASDAPPAPHALLAPPASLAPASPVSLGSELSVACPERIAPAYPAIARRLGEEGTVVLSVELDEQGHVDAAHIFVSSSHARLDAAALAAVRNWRCQPARRDGQPVRAVALQPFKFVLQGS